MCQYKIFLSATDKEIADKSKMRVDLFGDMKIKDIEELKTLLQKHVDYTGSLLAKDILENYEAWLPHFKKIVPVNYAHMLENIEKFEKQGYAHDEATLMAFKEVHQ